MSAAWVVYLLVAGTFLALGASAVASALSAAGRSTRWGWAAALGALLALGVVAPRSRTFTITSATTMQVPSAEALAAPARSGIVALVETIREPIQQTVFRAITIASAAIPSGAARVIVLGWTLASAVLFAVYLIVNLRMSRARRHWPRERLLGVDVRIAPTAGPAVIGVVRAEIVVPRALLQRSDDEQRLILAHEHEHLRARDNVLLGLACVAVIALPWHPAVWYILARLRLAIELDCDARVLRRGAAPRSYGALLIDMAAHGAGIRVGTLALADRPSHLERRLLAMRPHRSRFALVRGGASCALAGLLVLAACEAKVPTSAEMSSMDVAQMEKSVAKTGAFGDAKFENADFFYNGAPITAWQARKIEAENIGNMMVVKGARRDTVLLESKDQFKKAEGVEVSYTRIRGPSKTAHADEGMKIRTRGDARSQPAVMIDGVITTESALAGLSPEAIRSINVLKPSKTAPDRKYPNGLIVIETKAHAVKKP
jgi:beta-lactamase regulating signal transducer with metallopeptidase domain